MATGVMLPCPSLGPLRPSFFFFLVTHTQAPGRQQLSSNSLVLARSSSRLQQQAVLDVVHARQTWCQLKATAEARWRVMHHFTSPARWLANRQTVSVTVLGTTSTTLGAGFQREEKS
jgi:hypothetical protein